MRSFFEADVSSCGALLVSSNAVTRLQTCSLILACSSCVGTCACSAKQQDLLWPLPCVCCQSDAKGMSELAEKEPLASRDLLASICVLTFRTLFLRKRNLNLISILICYTLLLPSGKPPEVQCRGGAAMQGKLKHDLHVVNNQPESL